MEFINKLKAISYAVITPILTFTGIKEDIIIILSILIVFDILTAVIRELVTKEGRFKSAALWIGIGSKGLIILIPVLLALVGKGIGMDFKWFVDMSLSALVVAEAYSTLGNIVQIRKNDKSIDEQDAVTMVIKAIESVLKEIVTIMISKFKKSK